MGVPTTRPWSWAVITLIALEDAVEDTDCTFCIPSSALEKIEGTLLTVSNVSHLVDWSPYSKSVSIKFCGCETLSLWTGSTIARAGSIEVCCSSKNIWSLSVFCTPRPLKFCSKTISVYSVVELYVEDT